MHFQEQCSQKLPPTEQSPIDYASTELQTVKCAVEFSANEPTHAHTLLIDCSRYAALCVAGVKSFFSWGFHLLQRELICSTSPIYEHLLIKGTAAAFCYRKAVKPGCYFIALFDTSVTEWLVANYFVLLRTTQADSCG